MEFQQKMSVSFITFFLIEIITCSFPNLLYREHKFAYSELVLKCDE